MQTIPLTPRPAQRQAVSAALDGLERHERGQLIMSCGTGKTLVGLWISEQMPAERILVLAPSLSLVDQLIREWRANAGAPFEALALCSDRTVGSRAERDGDRMPVAMAVPVTTDPGRVRAFLARPGRRVLFSTYHSTPVLAEAQRAGAPALDLVVCDEAHRCAVKGDGAFRTVLDQDRIRAARRLFMTATPRVGTGAAAPSMDDPAQFGPVFHTYSMARATAEGRLSPLRVAVVGVSAAEAARLGLAPDELAGEAPCEAVQRIGLVRAIGRLGLTRVITYHSSIARARECAEELTRLGAGSGISADWISGAMSTGERNARLDTLRDVPAGCCRVLSNARCLTEGIDVPAIDGVVFMDPRRSVIDITQAFGRAARPAEGKDYGTAIVPVIVPEGDDPAEVMSQTRFRTVWAVHEALRAHDETFATELDSQRQCLGEGGRLRALRQTVWLMPEEAPEWFTEELTTLVVRHSSSSWWESLGRLRRQCEAGEGLDQKTLAWCAEQRRRYAEGSLSDERIDALEAVPGGFSWTPHADAFERGCRHLELFHVRFGHLNVPAGWICPDGVNLWRFGVEQRRLWREGKLSAGRQERLEAIPGWRWEVREDRLSQGLASLRRYAEREGHTLVPRAFVDEDGFPLGTWLSDKRGRRRPAPGSDEALRFEEVPHFVWDPAEAHWEEMCRVVDAERKRTGSTRISSSLRVHGRSVRAWKNNQLALHARGKLAPHRVRRLREIGLIPPEEPLALAA